MKQIDKIIKSQSEPKDLNVLWLDTSNPEEPILKEYDGGWKAVAGGGGSTGNAVSYDEQTLTDAQKMQARKNQGLYYEETIKGEKTVFTPDTPEYEWPYPDENVISYRDDDFMRITDDAPTQADIIEMIITDETTVAGSDLQSFDITGWIDLPSTVQGYSANPFVSSRQMFIVVSEDTVVDGNTYKKGIYVPYIHLFANPYVSEIIYNGTITTVHQISPKYIKDMYYEEGGVKTINYDINGDRVGGYTKVSDEVIEASAVIGHKFTSYSGTEYTITEDMVIAADDTHPTRILYDASYPNDWAILIFPEDMEFESYSFSKGVWFMDMGTIVNPNHIESLEYDGVTVHQIPAKYIPSTGLDVFEIKVSQNIMYGEPIEVENVTYQDIMDACAAGKYIVLTIFADDDIGVTGRCLGGNFSRMENTGGSIYGQPCYCFAGAYRKASSGSSGQFNGYSLKDVVLYEDANDGLLYVELQDSNLNG